MRNPTVCSHPLLQDALSRLRDKDTPVAEFRDLMARAGLILGLEALRRLNVKKTSVKTPLLPALAARVAEPVALIAVLRAGLGLMEGVSRLVPEAAHGHIGIYRNEETLSPVRYYVRLPRDLRRSLTIVCDPMLATGGSAAESVRILKDEGARRLVLLTLIAAEPGVRRFSREHPDVPVLTAGLDSRLNSRGYIVPGLGDAGDRMFGT